MSKKAILRTYGGLGNQIFQILYARLFVRKMNIKLFEIHDKKYEHAFERSKNLSIKEHPNSIEKIISNLRVPKFYQKIARGLEEPILIGNSYYLDGYFQSSENYEAYSKIHIKEEINNLRKELFIQPVYKSNILVHLRVGDFFSNKKYEKEHVIERLKKIRKKSHIMTNNENLLIEPDIFELITTKEAQIIKTKELCAENVLKIMVNYSYIDGNDSTLVFWASVFSGGSTNLKKKNLIDLNKFFKELL
jgi:hypothetical protein